VNEGQLVEAVIEAASREEAEEKFEQGDFKRFLIVKKDLRELTQVGKPEFEEIR
jgi:hypothetical protein